MQEIADEAGLNRATFYFHYPDKAALLSALADHQFRGILAKRGISFNDGDGALKTIVLGVCDNLTEFTSWWVNSCRLPIERSIVPSIEAVCLEGMAGFYLTPGIDPALLAVAGAWAVFGAARRWSQNPEGISANAMAQIIAAMVKPIFSSGLVLDPGECPAPKPA